MATKQFDAVLAEALRHFIGSGSAEFQQRNRAYFDRLAAAHAAEKEAAERDARRYRAIRNPPPKGDAMCAWSTTEDGVVSARGKHDGPLTGESLDAAIDVCMGEK